MSSLVSKKRRVLAALLAAVLLLGTGCSSGQQSTQAPEMTTYLMANGLAVDSWDEEYTDDSGCEITVHMQGLSLIHILRKATATSSPWPKSSSASAVKTATGFSATAAMNS